MQRWNCLNFDPLDPPRGGADVDDSPAAGEFVSLQLVVHGEVPVRLGAQVGHQLRQIEAIVLQCNVGANVEIMKCP